MTACLMKAWLSEFLFVRQYFSGVTGKPLYSYLVEFGEYQKLKSILMANQSAAFHPVKGMHWAAIYCLYIAERFRRDYGENSGEWSWEWADSMLGCQFNHQQHTRLVEFGLDYWQRPIRKSTTGRNLLGSLFLEGGLPWPLVKSETHGFGRVIRYGLKHFHDHQAVLGNTSDLVAHSERYLPHTFQNLDTRLLLAGVIEQLMFIADKHPNLKQESNPISYLDRVEPNWRRDFPLPLNEANAPSIINDWLRDASHRQAEKKTADVEQKNFLCEHLLLGDIREYWQIQTELLLPERFSFGIPNDQLTSTRFEVVFYEGEKLIARSGVVYGQVNGNSFEVRFPKQRVRLQRSNVEEPISLALLDNGSLIAQQLFDNSALDLSDSPLIFEREGDEKRLLCTATCNTENSEVLVRVPPEARYTPKSSVVIQHMEKSGALWLLVSDHLDIIAADDLFTIRPNSNQKYGFIRLDGNLLTYDSIPKTVFKGWPKVLSADGKRSSSPLQEYANGKRLCNSAPYPERAGVFHYVIKGQSGETLLRRRFGVLPTGFDFTLFASDDKKPARLHVTGYGTCTVHVYAAHTKVVEEFSNNGKSYQLHNDWPETPSVFFLEVKSTDNVEPVRLCIPFPYMGARLLDDKNKVIDYRHLVLDQLFGKRVALFAARQDQVFYLRLKLIAPENINIKHDYSLVKPGDKPLSISLFAYQNDIRQMMAAVKSQDAYMELTIETPQQRLLTLYVKRYNGEIKQNDDNSFITYELDSGKIASEAKVVAMLLSDPKRKPLELTERKTQGIGTGRFQVCVEMQKASPWLLYPHTESSIHFRPKLFIPDLPAKIEVSISEPHSLHEAARLFHPKANPHVIDQQITGMATDLDHSGWQYLDDLRKNYSHLPLSTFESWLSLSNCYPALAVSLFRLEVDEPFSDRMRDELAIIWECIPLQIWSDAYKAFEAWLIETGLPDHYRKIMLQNRKCVLRKVVSGFEEMAGYFETGDTEKLPCIPPELVLPGWRDQLIDTHENTIWPNELKSKLANWIERQELPPLVKALPTGEKYDAVIYLPIFMAFVTAGKVSVNDISPELPLPALKFFIRKLSDFDKTAWYAPTHALLASYLLANHKD